MPLDIQRLPRRRFRAAWSLSLAVVPPLSVAVHDAVGVRIVSVVQALDHISISGGLVRKFGDRPIETKTLAPLIQEGHGGFRVPPGRRTEIDELPFPVDCPPKISPSTIDPDIGLVDVPLKAAPTAVGKRAWRFRARTSGGSERPWLGLT